MRCRRHRPTGTITRIVDPGGIATVSVDGHASGLINFTARRSAVVAVWTSPALRQGTHRIVLVPPYTSDGFAAGQSVVIPDWSAILPLVHQSFP